MLKKTSILVALFAFLSVTASYGAILLQDDFEGGKLDESKWLPKKEWKIIKPEAKIKAFGWYTKLISGNDYKEIENTITKIPEDNILPVCIILDTNKGAGVSFMDAPEWHAKVPNKEEYEKAMKELS